MIASPHMIDIRQSPQYAKFMEDLGWRVEKVGKWKAFVKKFPLIGSFIKIQKIKPPIPFEEIEQLRRQYKFFKIQIAPEVYFTPGVKWADIKVQNQLINYGYRIDRSPNIPTKTIHIDITQSEKNLFNNFIEAKRRAVRRAVKNNVVVKESYDIDLFINLRKKQNFPLGFLLEKEMMSLWKNFYPKKTTLLLASCQFNAAAKNWQDIVLAGILLLFHDHTAYYWYASSSSQGKKLFAPTLLVWEALKIAKEKGAKVFDFEGIFDERFPKATNSWKGFSKFKEGFGGKKITYLGSFLR